MASVGATKWPSFAKLKENPDEELQECIKILLKFANNVIQNPHEAKYRKIRVGNPTVMEKLIPVSGAMECLFDMGFQEDDQYFTLPMNASIENIKQVRNKLQELQNTSHKAEAAGAVASLPSPGVTQSSGAAKPPTNNPDFLRKILSSYEHVLIYEDPELQAKARSVVPMKELTDKARDKQSEISSQGEQDIDLPDLILLELLAWFKTSFFRWVDAPRCERCGGETRSMGMASPLPAETMWGAGRVENYQCKTCATYTRFPRYNHPGKLLDTRQGRCGEWANCFTLLCRAVGREARYVLDWTDHVWTEVYSDIQQRWLHCDACENSCDKPLVYEAGWNKKLSYIIAFSKDDIQDVTWRYSADHQSVLRRRTEVPESFLLNTIVRLREKRQKNLTQVHKDILQARLVAELVEFMKVKKAGDGELEGRLSGSKAWRLARGETKADSNQHSPHVIEITEEEKKNKLVHIQYSCAADMYVRITEQGKKTSGWKSLVYEVKNIHRKEEHDWNMTYLARTEGSSSASLVWKFNFKDCEINDVEIQAESTCYEDGQVSWRLCAGDQCAMLRKDGRRTKITNLTGCKELTLTAELSRGKGDVAWQHTQLFRQATSDTHKYPLDIIIHLQ